MIVGSPGMIEVAVFSHRGVRRVRNQDRAVVAGWFAPDGAAMVLHIRIDRPVLVAVADGAGGHPFGERASGDALAHIAAIRPVPSTPGELADSVVAAHHALHDQSVLEPESAGMATTVAAVVVTARETVYANVGDSAIFDLSTGDLFQLSVDDHPPRPPGIDPDARSSVVTQLVGGVHRPAVPKPHVGRCVTEDGLRLLICSDGLEAVVAQDRIATLVREAPTDAQAVRALVEEALRGGAPDNVTVMMIRVRGVGDE